MALVVFTGGARSGKSAAAARLAESRRSQVVVAVAGVARDDAEMAARIEQHRADRPAAWITLEVAGVPIAEWLPTVPADAVLLLDCLGTLLSDVLWGSGAEPGDEAAAETLARVLTDALAGRAGDTIIVTNEVGMGVVPVSASGRLFRDVLGRANARLVASADAAYLVVCGRSIDLCAAPADPAWPTHE
jgi:adenosylcobinamide kinase/adenosylcobinamide-phosphate guanylyltransferase